MATFPWAESELGKLQRGNRFDKMIKPLAETVHLSGVVWYRYRFYQRFLRRPITS